MASVGFALPGRGPLRRLRSATSLAAMRRQENEHTYLNVMIASHRVAWSVVRHQLGRPCGQAEACQHNENGRTLLYNVLSRRVDDYPPLDVVESLIQADPKAVNIQNGFSPLEVACQRRASLEILEALMAGRAAVAQDSEAFIAFWKSYSELMGEDLVEFLRGGGREAAKIIVRLERLLQYCCPSSGTWLPLHAAASLPMCPAGVMIVFMSLAPEMIRKPDEQGRLPLHHVASIGKKESSDDGVTDDDCCVPYTQRLRLLLAMDITTAQRKDKCSALPLHVAASSGLPQSGLAILAEAFPDAMYQRQDGLFPAFLAAACPQSTLDEVYYLLSAAPNVLHM